MELKFFNGFDKLVHSVILQEPTSIINSIRFTTFFLDINVNNSLVPNINNLPYGNYDFEIYGQDVNAWFTVLYSRGQAFLAGDNEIQKIEYISDNETSESIIYVS